jgi:hypothetical protein
VPWFTLEGFVVQCRALNTVAARGADMGNWKCGAEVR